MTEKWAGRIESNLKRSTLSYDEELPTPVVEILRSEKSSQQTIEEEQKLFEENYRAAYKWRWQGQERWMGRENEEMRLVNIMHPDAVIQKLIDAGVDAALEPAVVWIWGIDDTTGLTVPVQKARSRARLWLHDVVVQQRVGISAWVMENGQRVVKCITSLQYDCGPEWSLMYFDQYDVPIKERYRGWRTALLALILNDVITEEEVDRAFGPVVENEASELYRETLQNYRERKTGMK